MPTRPVAVILLVLLFLAAVAVPAVAVPAVAVAGYVGRQVDTDQRISQLEQQVERLETDVSLLRE